MSPVTPNPAAEFSTFAITKSISRCSTIAGMARLAISRPGLPKMSPMNRIRTLVLVSPHGNPPFPAAPLLDPRQQHTQFARAERGVGASDVERTHQPNAAGEASERPFGDVERGLALVLTCRRALAPRHNQGVLGNDDLHGLRRHAGEVHHDLEARGGLDDVDWRTAFG